MRSVVVRLFARARDLAGADTVTLRLPETATVGDLRRELASAFPVLGQLLERSAVAVNQEFAGDGLSLPPQAEIALLPPVSGGQTSALPGPRAAARGAKLPFT
jgi:molybdopterin converting factor subunit 1